MKKLELLSMEKYLIRLPTYSYISFWFILIKLSLGLQAWREEGFLPPFFFVVGIEIALQVGFSKCS